MFLVKVPNDALKGNIFVALKCLKKKYLNYAGYQFKVKLR